MCNASHFPEIVLLLTSGNLKFPTWIQKNLDILQTVTYEATNYIFCDREVITFLHYFILLKDVLMTKKTNIIRRDFTHLTKATLLT